MLSFLSTVADNVPVVGLVKGIGHYAVGDYKGAKRAVYLSTRTTAVLAAGALCAPAGLVIAATGSAASAIATDIVAHEVMDTKGGFVQDCENIKNDIVAGKFPTTSLINTAVHIGVDATGGLGGFALSSVAKEGGKMTAKILAGNAMLEVGALTTSGHVLCRVVDENENRNNQLYTWNTPQNSNTEQEGDGNAQQNTNNSNTNTGQGSSTNAQQNSNNSNTNTGQGSSTNAQQNSNTNTGQGSSTNGGNTNNGQGPNRNGGRKPRKNPLYRPESAGCRDDGLESFLRFLELLQEHLIEYWNNEESNRKSKEELFFMFIFELETYERKYLIQKVLNHIDSLDTVLKFEIRFFDMYFPGEFTFWNSISVLEFVNCYVEEEAENFENNLGGLELSEDELLDLMVSRFVTDINVMQELSDWFQCIQAQIEFEDSHDVLYPNFRDIFAAVYHYFKHKSVPGNGELSVKEYYDLIRHMLKKVKRFSEYYDLENPLNDRSFIKLEQVVLKYRGAHNVRIRIILRFQNGGIVLSSCYIVDDMIRQYSDEDDGNLYLNDVLQPRGDYNDLPPQN